MTTTFCVIQLVSVFNLDEGNFANAYFVCFIALFYTILFLITYISHTLIPQKVELLLEETYPEYKMI